MIIDIILDRKDFENMGDFGYYDPDKFAKDFMDYACELERDKEWPLDEKIKAGDEDGVRKILCDYIIGFGYEPEICDYVNSVQWCCRNPQGMAKRQKKPKGKGKGRNNQDTKMKVYVLVYEDRHNCNTNVSVFAKREDAVQSVIDDIIRVYEDYEYLDELVDSVKRDINAHGYYDDDDQCWTISEQEVIG